MMDWKDEDAIRLVEAYRTNSLIWDPKHMDYFKRRLKEDSWREIGGIMQIPVDECKRMMVRLLSSYRCEKAKVKSSQESANGTNDNYVSKWFAYEAFRFLEHRDIPKKRMCTDTGEVTDENNEAEQGTETKSAAAHCKRLKVDENDSFSEALSNTRGILKTTAEKLNNEPAQHDEIDSFFTYVTAKVRNYSPQTKKKVQHAVFDILMKADQGFFDWTGSTLPCTLHIPNQQCSAGLSALVCSRPRKESPSLIVQGKLEKILPNAVSTRPSAASSITSGSFEEFV